MFKGFLNYYLLTFWKVKVTFLYLLLDRIRGTSNFPCFCWHDHHGSTGWGSSQFIACHIAGAGKLVDDNSSQQLIIDMARYSTGEHRGWPRSNKMSKVQLPSFSRLGSLRTFLPLTMVNVSARRSNATQYKVRHQFVPQAHLWNLDRAKKKIPHHNPTRSNPFPTKVLQWIALGHQAAIKNVIIITLFIITPPLFLLNLAILIVYFIQILDYHRLSSEFASGWPEESPFTQVLLETIYGFDYPQNLT